MRLTHHFPCSINFLDVLQLDFQTNIMNSSNFIISRRVGVLHHLDHPSGQIIVRFFHEQVNDFVKSLGLVSVHVKAFVFRVKVLQRHVGQWRMTSIAFWPFRDMLSTSVFLKILSKLNTLHILAEAQSFCEVIQTIMESAENMKINEISLS